MKSAYWLFLFFANTPFAPSQNFFWQQTNGPQGGFISSICFLDSIMLAGGAGGVFMSSHNAEHWTHIGIPQEQVNRIVTSNGILFAGTNRHGIYRSTDGGVSWVQANVGLTSSGIVDMVAKDTLIFAATRFGGVFRTTSSGELWQPVNNGIIHREMRSITVSNNAIIAFGASGSGSGMFRTTNDGLSWSLLPYGWNAESMCKFNNTLYASGSSNYAKVYLSTDDGLTWYLPSGASAPNDIIISLYADQTGIYAGMYLYGMYRSNNSGVAWANVGNGLYNKSPYRIVGNGQVVFAASYDGIRRTTNAGSSWQEKNSGLTNGQVSCMTSVGGFIFAGTQGSGLFRSSDLGGTWTQVAPSVVRPFLNDIISVQGTLYIITLADWSFAGTVLMSNDFGNTWNERRNGIDANNLRSIASGTGVLYVSSDYGVFKSVNAGLSWTRMVNGIPNNGRPNIPSISAVGSVAIAVNGGSWIYRSTDAGEHWTSVVPPGFFGALGRVATVDTMMFAGCSDVNYLFKSSDMGATWQRVQAPLVNGAVTGVVGNQGVFYVAVSGNGVITNRGGNTWGFLNSGLLTTDVRSIHFVQGRAWAGSWGAGVFRMVDSSEMVSQPVAIAPANGAENQAILTSLSWHQSASAQSYRLQLSPDLGFTTLLVEDSTLVDTCRIAGPLAYETTYYWRVSAANLLGSGAFSEPWSFMTAQRPPDTTLLPSSFSIEQNYPNPFNSETIIRFAVPFTSTIEIAVYDILGKQVATVVNEEFPKGIYYRIWNASKLPSGVYFYRLETGSHTQANKALLLK